MSDFAFPWEKLAMKNAPVPSGLSLRDIQAYTSLRNIYSAYHDGKIDRDTASKEKQEIIRAYKENQQAEKLIDFHAKMYKLTEAAKIQFKKDQTIENAMKLYYAMDGIEKTII